ncbi:unnamed protein product [Penicillium roqueforti FM164]|uniref:Uncharacterized protein n=1 Tax=Penicillium roqueforti (strain FM164) TaxID=1365484 RepID=W6QNL5_PENRF|nr:unnamed protein product [Penicillium roqueforti FM164]
MRGKARDNPAVTPNIHDHRSYLLVNPCIFVGTYQIEAYSVNIHPFNSISCSHRFQIYLQWETDNA